MLHPEPRRKATDTDPTAKIVYVPRPHRCEMPVTRSMVSDFEPGTIVRCPECGAYWSLKFRGWRRLDALSVLWCRIAGRIPVP